MTEHPGHPINADQLAPLATDRRRPGRSKYLNPHLLEILRRPSQEGATFPQESGEGLQEAGEDYSDNLRAARGIGLSAVIGTGLWAALVWSALHWL